VSLKPVDDRQVGIHLVVESTFVRLTGATIDALRVRDGLRSRMTVLQCDWTEIEQFSGEILAISDTYEDGFSFLAGDTTTLFSLFSGDVGAFLITQNFPTTGSKLSDTPSDVIKTRSSAIQRVGTK
jgi:hypothetical protein